MKLRYRDMLGRAAYELLPPLFMLRANLKVRANEKTGNPRSSDWLKLPEETLQKTVDAEWKRARQLDDKLSKVTAALAVAVTIGSVISKTFAEGLSPDAWRVAVLVLLTLAMILMLMGALLGFNGLRPKRRPATGPDYEFAANVGADARKELAVKALAIFEADNTIRANEASAAIDTLRNGVTLFTLSILLSTFAPTALPEPTVLPQAVRPAINAETAAEPCDEQRRLPLQPAPSPSSDSQPPSLQNGGKDDF